MAQVRVMAESRVDAPSAVVYRCIADFRKHHPRFLPPAFSDFRVEQGGIGAGTVISFRLTVGGRGRSFRSQVSEPEPGRVLVESDTASSSVTTFTVEPEGGVCRVRIETAWPSAGGITGFFERLFGPLALRSLYLDELERLEEHAQGHLLKEE